MPDIYSLSIRITSSSKPAITAIDNIITALSRLNAALNNYSDGSLYLKGLQSLTGGLRGIADSVNSIDLDKLKRLSTTLSSLSGAGEKISRLNFVSSFSELGSEVQRANSAISNTARSLAKEFHIPNSEMGSLTDSVRKLYSSTNEATFNDASRELERLVE